MAEALAAADPALVEAALREGAVARERPSPGLADYFGDLGVAVARALDKVIGALADAVGGAVSGSFLIGILGVMLGLALLLLVFLLVRLWLRRPKPRPAVELVPAGGPPALPPGADWEAEIERRLAGGEVRPALEALWWWLAGKIEARAAERSWTTRELVRRAGRQDLLRAVMPLDRLLYAAGQPAAADVRGLFDSLRGQLGGGAPAAGAAA